MVRGLPADASLIEPGRVFQKVTDSNRLAEARPQPGQVKIVRNRHVQTNLSAVDQLTHPLDTGHSVLGVNVSPKVEGLRVHHGYDGELILKAPFLCGQRYVATLGPELVAILPMGLPP